MFVYNKLRGRIIEKYGTLNSFASAVGITDVALSRKFNNKSGISRDEIVRWADLLDISPDEYGAYFFAREV